MLICPALLIATVFDLRSREVPSWLTLSLLLGSGVFAAFQGEWLPALLVAALGLISEITIPAQRRLMAAVLTAFSVFSTLSASPLLPTTLTCLALFAIWLLWDLNRMGGADMKLLMAVLLALSNPLVLLPITLVGGLQGAVGLLRKQTSVPYVLSIFLGTLLYTLAPLIL